MDTCPHCGVVIERRGKPRSLPQHARFFAIISAAFENWPESADFQPETADHLRSYLICKAGFSDSTDIAAPFAEDQPGLTRLLAVSIEAAITAAGGYAFIRPHPDGGAVRVYKAKSIKFSKMSHLDFCALSDAVMDQLRAEGLDPDALSRNQEAAA